MRIQNYELEPYEYGYMVSEWKTQNKEGTENFGQEYKADTKYPKDLQRAIEMVRDNLQRTKTANTLTELLRDFQELDKVFLEELQKVLCK